MTTFGNTTVEPTPNPLNDGIITVFRFTLPVAGSITSITEQVVGSGAVGAGSQVWRYALYADSAGAPGTFLRATSEMTGTNTDASAPVTANLSTAYAAAAADYHFGDWAGAVNHKVSALYVGSGGVRNYNVSAPYSSSGDPPAPFGTPSGTDAVLYTVYATYTAAPAGGRSHGTLMGVSMGGELIPRWLRRLRWQRRHAEPGALLGFVAEPFPSRPHALREVEPVRGIVVPRVALVRP